uniref:Putative gamma-interferon inducible lysosomal thiol reductase n=1 Tax=Psorophora albipes TaxID=869069 RepID=T1DIS2_9DIPT
MQRSVSILLLFSIVVATNVALLSADASKIHMTVFYEHLCPDSIRFVTQQLAPNWAAFRDHVDVEFIPFGKSRSFNGGESFQCQHGPAECQGNMFQSCVLQQLPDQDQQVSYVACQMDFSADPRGEECAYRAGVDLAAVDNCAQSVHGIQLQLEAERRTQQIPLTFVPSIAFNGVFDKQLSDLAYKNLPAALCKVTNNAFNVC